MVEKLENKHNRTPGREVKAGNLEYEAGMLRVLFKSSILFLISLPLFLCSWYSAVPFCSFKFMLQHLPFTLVKLFPDCH